MIIPPQICGGCKRSILGHNKNVICATCSRICHFKCTAQLDYQLTHPPSNTSNAVWHCKKCAIRENAAGSSEPRYNPFLNFLQNNGTRFDSINCNDEFHIASEILENCKAFESISDFNNQISRANFKCSEPTNFSIFFNNIDGNKSNFDSLTVDLKRHETKFSIIAVCETNIDSSHKNLYQIEGYDSCYQSKIVDKSKGSGLGLYIKDTYTFDTISESSACSPDIETLFIKITNTNEPVTIGVVYRPPNGSLTTFNHQFQSILETLPKSNVYITGDFNINLHSVNEHAGARLFQESFISTGIYPTISLSTHEMPYCNASCIDNILTNNTANVTLSATIKESVSHHLPIICLSTSEQFAPISGNKLPSTNTFSRYNFNQSNTAVMLSETLMLSDHHLKNILQPDFDGLVSAFTDIVNKTCKEEITTKSKRNPVDNPWITQGIIISVNKKHDLYKSWQKTIKNKKDPNDQGDPEHHNRYLNHRKLLNYIIKHAKESYNVKKIEDAEGDMKATWKLINHIRGKKNSKIAPAFFYRW